jgi:hypothetical protein
MQSALDALSPSCTESESRLADISLIIHDELAKHAIDESYLSILQNVQKSASVLSAPTRCADLFAAYAVLRENS